MVGTTELKETFIPCCTVYTARSFLILPKTGLNKHFFLYVRACVCVYVCVMSHKINNLTTEIPLKLVMAYQDSFTIPNVCNTKITGITNIRMSIILIL